MKFGEPTPDRTVTADGYMVGGAIMAPPGKIGLIHKQYINRVTLSKYSRGPSLTYSY